MIFRYIAFHYLKKVLIILIGLTGFFVGLDFLMNGGNFSAFNIKVFYIFNRWQESLNFFYPLSLIFGAVWTQIEFIKNNTMGAIYALGVSRREVLNPFLFVSLTTYLLFVGLNFTPFATAKDTAQALKNKEFDIGGKSEELFFKYNDSFVYIDLLLPFEQKLKNLTIFELEKGRVVNILNAESAVYDGSQWLAENIIQKKKWVDKDGKEILKIEKIEELNTLKGYHPRILNSIYENKELTLYESIVAGKLLSKQGVDTYKIRSDIYGKTVMPLFSIALLMILVFRFPFHARYMNMGIVSAKTMGGTIFIWGLFIALQQMASTAVIVPEVAIILPVVLLWIYAFYVFRKSDDT